MLDPRIQALRAIEALRAGVPNRDAVTALGSNNSKIEDEFRLRLGNVANGTGGTAAHSGFMVAGNFGTGKSHLLEYLQKVGLEERFVVSKIIISKETPLHDPVKLYSTAIRSATVPQRVGSALTQIASELKFNSSSYAEFYRWVQQESGLNQRFAATLYLYEYAHADPELQDRVIGFWSGDNIPVGQLKSALKQLGQAGNYSFAPVKVAELARQRFRFAARLMRAAGYAGWILLFDEVDLVGRYTANQRAKAYGEVARWTGNILDDTYPGIVSVMAITSAYAAEVLEGKNDWDAIPGRLRASHKPVDNDLAPLAETGMQLITEARPLTPPTDAVVDAIYETVRSIYSVAFDWDPPYVGDHLERTTTTKMRDYVRSWINEWDLIRLFPGHVSNIEVTPIEFDYGEDTDLGSVANEDAEQFVAEAD